jgi:hypothetical protein
MNANLPKESVVMIHDAGYVSYAARFQLVDLVGLKTPVATEIHKAITFPSAGMLRGDAVAKIATMFQPRYLVALQDWDDGSQLTAGLRSRGWTVDELYAGRAMSRTPAYLIFHLYRLAPPGQG